MILFLPKSISEMELNYPDVSGKAIYYFKKEKLSRLHKRMFEEINQILFGKHANCKVYLKGNKVK